MLCKNCEKVIPENQTVCSYCGTSAVDILSDNSNAKNNNSRYSNRKRNRKKNKKNNITPINDVINTEFQQSDTENPDNMPQEFKPELEPLQSVPEMPNPPMESPQQQTVPQPEIPNPPTEPTKNIQVDTMAEIERVSKNSELPKPDNKRKLPEASGIMYEIAEELYIKEKTAAEIEALCQPPFKKVFSEKQIKQLDEQAKEKARTMVSSTVTESEPEIKPEPQVVCESEKDDSKQNKPVTTAGAFLLQFVLLIPIVNIATAMFFSFRKSANLNMRAYSRAFLMWCVIVMFALIAFLTVMYFSNSSYRVINIDFRNLFPS